MQVMKINFVYLQIKFSIKKKKYSQNINYVPLVQIAVAGTCLKNTYLHSVILLGYRVLYSLVCTILLYDYRNNNYPSSPTYILSNVLFSYYVKAKYF